MEAGRKPDLRFEFGRNWNSYSALVTDAQIEEATGGMTRLLGEGSLRGRTFLDLGSGSGLHALAALRLGADSVCAADIDAESVATTRSMLARYGGAERSGAIRQDILSASPEQLSTFDVVYSWGVLHHTGQLQNAMRRAAALVAPGGVFAFALYRKTWCCRLWALEKRWYVRAGESSRRRARAVYRFAVRAGLGLIGRSFAGYVQTYRTRRGMDFEHDVHDWLGGYPYESVSPREVDALMQSLGFVAAYRSTRSDLFSRSGLLGSGCDEYVFRRPAT